MSTSTATPPDPFAPVPTNDAYAVYAGGTFFAPAEIFNNQGLLGNDSEISGGVVGGLTLRVTGLGWSPEAISNTLSRTSAFGEWTVQPNGALTYSANGLGSKQLLEGQTWTEMLYYEAANLFQKTAIGQVAMTITGAYDPLEASSDPAWHTSFDEDAWKDWIGSGNIQFSLPVVRIDYIDNPANLDVLLEANIRAGTNVQNLFSSELDDLARSVRPSLVEANDTLGLYFSPDFFITKADLDFLRPGDQIGIDLKFTVSDGITSAFFTSYLTIDGADHPLFPAPDTANVTQPGSIDREASVSVLNNDVDPDFQGDMKVFSVESNVTPWTIIFDGARGPIRGDYGWLHMFGDGSYEYIPFAENLYLLQSVTDHFVYQVMNDVQSADSTLDITINPYPGVVAVSSDIAQSVELDEELMLLNGPETMVDINFFSYTILGDVYTESVRDITPVFVVDFVSDYFSPASHMPSLRNVVALALDATSLEILANQDLNAAEGRWKSSSTVAFHMNHLSGFDNFNFLSEGDRITVTYEIRGDQGQSIQEGNDVLEIIYDKTVLLQISILGQNDAPIPFSDSNSVYMGDFVYVSSNYSAFGLLNNDFDYDLEDELGVSFVHAEASYSTVSANSPGIVQGSFGTLTVYGDGSYSYQANPLSTDTASEPEDVSGGIDTFWYTVTDRFGASAEEMLNIYVMGPDAPPLAVPDEIFIELDDWDSTDPLPNILANDSDYDPSRLTVGQIYQLPDQYLEVDTLGNILLNWSALKSLKDDQHLTLLFSYTATNGLAESDPAVVFVHIDGQNEEPIPASDAYFYENIAGSAFDVSPSDGLILHKNIFDGKTDVDIDNDSLIVSAISSDTLHWVNVTDGSALLQWDGDISVRVRADGGFVLDTPDAYRGVVSFSYLLSDGQTTSTGSASIEVGGPAPQQGQLLINEISLDNPLLVRNVYTDNGSAPNRIQVGKASIELLNDSTQQITAAQLAKMTIEIIGAGGGGMTSIDLRHLTGFTEDAGGNALNKFFIPAGGVLMLYEPGSSGWGTWALYGPNKTFIIGGSGSYVGQGWPLGSTTKDAVAINLTQNDTSIDLFAANGADINLLTGIIGLGDTQQGENSGSGVPWAGTDIGTLAGVQYEGSASDATDTVFARRSLTDTNSEMDWGNFSRLAITIGDVNDKKNIHIQNPDDPTDNMDPDQGSAGVVGQQKSVVSGSDSGDSGPDVLVGQGNDDTLTGGGGDDLQIGGGGNDSIDGGTGGDNIHGGAGADLLRGGTGNDVFVYEAVSDSNPLDTDVILDFGDGQDKLDLSLIDADTTKPGDQAFAWGGAVAGRPPTGVVEGKVVYWVQGGLTFVQADAAGDGLPPLELMLSGIHALDPADFVF